MMTRAREIVFVDFEFYQPDGELPSPLCLVAHEKHSGRVVRLVRDEFPSKPPYSVASDAILVAFAASDGLHSHRARAWAMPENVIDLHAEFLNASNFLERSTQPEDSLLSVLASLGIPHITSVEKDRMREIAITGGPRTPEEATALLDYCASDVVPLAKL